MSERDDLDEIAAELYVLPPAEFTAARKARAGMAERSVAAQVTALRKPSIAAWTVNLLARRGGLDEALELAAALREAQDDLDAAELSRLGRQRRALVSALATQAVALAGEVGVTVGPAARDAVEKTINAAVMDAAAAAAVRTARLVTALEAGAFEPSDLADAVGGSVPGVATPPPRDDLAEQRARKAAAKAVREAETAANEAERELTRVQAQRDRLRQRVDHIAERIDDLRSDLERLEAEQAAAGAELAEIEEKASAAASRARSTAKDAERARHALPE